MVNKILSTRLVHIDDNYNITYAIEICIDKNNIDQQNNMYSYYISKIEHIDGLTKKQLDDIKRRGILLLKSTYLGYKDTERYMFWVQVNKLT